MAAAFEVLLTRGAEQDLEEILAHIAGVDGVPRADRVLDGLMKVVANLAQFPQRGSYPKELLALGIKAFRQTAFKPYRVIYRVDDRRVLVYVIADGRRDFQSLLARRLLGA